VSNDEVALTLSGEVGGEGGGGDVGPSSASFEGSSDLPSSSSGIPLKEEKYTTPLARSHTRAGSLDLDATHFW